MLISEESALLLLDLDEDALMARLGPATWAQGAGALRAGKVSSIENDEPEVYVGRVKDRGLSYKTWVSLLGGNISLSCACPEGVDCFHSAALLQALRSQAQAQTRTQSPWRARLVSLVGEPTRKGEPLALLVDASDPNRPILLEPLRRGRSVPWTRKRASWPDLVSTQWESVTEGIDPVHLGLIREGYLLSRSDSSWQSRQEVSLASLGDKGFDWLRRLEKDGVLLLHSLDLIEPLVLDPSTWDLGLDLRMEEEALSLGVIARNGELSVVRPHIEAATRLLVLDGGRRFARLAPSDLLQEIPGRGMKIPAEDIAEFRAEFLPRLSRRYSIVSSDSSIDFDSAPRVRLVATVRMETGENIVVRWWAEFDYTGTPSRLPLSRAMDDPQVKRIAERIDARGAALVSEGLWAKGPSSLRLPAWRAEELREKLVARITDPELEWDLSEEVAGLVLDESPARIHADIDPLDSDWFGLRISLEVEGVEVPLAEVLEALGAGEEHLCVAGRWVSLDGPKLRRLAALLEEARLLGDGPQARLNRLHVGLWEQIEEDADVLGAPGEWRKRLSAFDATPEELPIVHPACVTLRPYQLEGIDWLTTRAGAGFGGILADDMGLGKTLQVLTLIATLKGSGIVHAPVLVVAPTSVLSTWKSEAARFFPELIVEVVAETARRRGMDLPSIITGADLVITSYTIARLDAEEWEAQEFGGLVIDEAQAAKNPRTAIHKVLREITTPWVFAVTGTPVENSLTDLWAILTLTTPGLLPGWKTFTEKIRRPIETEGDEAALERLHRLIAPFMLRRTKEGVAEDLPDKVESVLRIDLGAEHRRIYEQYLMRERAKILSLVDDAKSRIDLLASITRLRQLALDPALVVEDYASIGSTKVEYLADQLDEIIPRGHRALVFSQFTSFLARIRLFLERRGVRVVQLDGTTRDRDGVIEEFRSGEAPVFLISLKAGGTGLTLTEADYVYVMDPWWNPAAEEQAVDRAHRIGQKKKVNVYRLVAADTIEDRVVALQERKRRLVTSVVEEAGQASGFKPADIASLLE